MPQRRKNFVPPIPVIPSRVAGNIPRTTQNDFFQFDKIPNGVISKCDSLEITDLRTPKFVYTNIFGGRHEDEETVVLKTHVILLLGDDEDAELVTEDDLSFLVDEFCS